MRLSLGVAIAGGLLCAACGSGGDADPVESTVAETVVETTEPAATTEPPVQTTEPTIETTEPTAPPTTELSEEALIAQIEADLNEGEQALFAAGADPSDPELRRTLERFYTDTALAVALGALDQLVADDLYVRPNPDVASVNVVRGLVERGTDEAVVEVCRVDAAVVADRLPGGGEAIVNDTVRRTDARVEVVYADGTWASRGGGEVLHEQVGVASCDD